MSARLGATYRLQLGPRFGFRDAAGVVDYLAALGIEQCYLSPVAEAVPGSAHGYDGTDPTALRAELGGDAGFAELAGACSAAGIGIVLDIVPNHLATWPGGPWWRDVLAAGERSRYAPVFDIDWAAAGGRVLLPVLDRPLGAAVASGLVRVVTAADGSSVLESPAGPLPLCAPVEPGDALDDVLGAQHYRLVDYHDRGARNYRRFFDIDGLVGLRVEDPEVFARTHALVVRLVEAGLVDALRVDHVDGLADPDGYLDRLSRATGGAPILVEKILTGDEALRANWPVAGTTGYEVLDDIAGALVDSDGLERLAAAARAEGEPDPVALGPACKSLVAASLFPAELARLAKALGTDPATLGGLGARLGVYRTYLGPPGRPADEADLATLAAAASGAPELYARLLDPANRRALAAFQQLTGALSAKGVEDTALYRLAGRLAFCEVGGDPARRRADGVARLHARAAARALDGRAGLVPSSTHDTKRSGDARARLLALAECPEELEAGLAALREALGDARAGYPPGAFAFDTRILASQLLAIWPSTGELDDELAERLAGALVKGAREAKLHSSWDAPDPGYEAALAGLARRCVADGGALARATLGALFVRSSRLAATLSLGALVLAHALPGRPDCYQGDEVWNGALVDPDNRRAVDFASLRAGLAALGARDGLAGQLAARWRDGRVKQLVTARALAARRACGDALAPGARYSPLAARGAPARSVLALERGGRCVAAVTRRPSALAHAPDALPAGDSYGGGVLVLSPGAPARYLEVLSGRTLVAERSELGLSELFAQLPVALLCAT